MSLWGRISNNDAGGVDGGVGEAEGSDDAVTTAFGGPEMDEQDLVFGVEYDAGKFNAAADEIAGRELALENRVLEMVAKTAHEFEDFAETAVVGDVVTDEIGLAHLVYLRAGGVAILTDGVPILHFGMMSSSSNPSQLGNAVRWIGWGSLSRLAECVYRLI